MTSSSTLGCMGPSCELGGGFLSRSYRALQKRVQISRIVFVQFVPDYLRIQMESRGAFPSTFVCKQAAFDHKRCQTMYRPLEPITGNKGDPNNLPVGAFTPRKEIVDFVKGLDDVGRRDGAEFMRALQVGDEVGGWSRVNPSDNVTVMEGVRVTLFWEV